ncbi:MAG TPA: mandelate racemase/muconate lactonizing enzyme family protein [Limnochordia bacterium]
MKITDVRCLVLEDRKKYAAPQGAEEAAGVGYLCLIRVDTDAGITGWADVETQPHVAHAAVHAPPSGSGLFEGLRELVVGEDPFEVERLWEKVYRGTAYYGRRGVAIQVLSGFDIACWDIIGKATGLPIYKLLGAGYRRRVRAYASTLFRPTPDDMKRACEHYLARGFTAVKFGWGVFGEDPVRDIALVRAAREALPDSCELLIDPGWTRRRTARDAIELCRQLEPYRIFWVEDFLHPEDYAGYARVSQSVSVRIAAGEQEATPWGFRRLIEEGKIDVAQPDLSRCGGLTAARKIMWMVEENRIDMAPHAWLTDLLGAASLHVNAALPRSLFVEYNVSANPMLRDIIATPLSLDSDGYIEVPDRPGLGIEVDEAAIERYRIL